MNEIKIRELFLKYREPVMYLFFGGCTTMVSIASYWILTRLTGLGSSETLANTIANLIAITFAYITNRTFVFENKAHTAKGICREAAGFYAARFLTLLLENAIMFIFVEKMRWNDMAVKVAATVLVIVLNYVFSKLFIFRKEKKTE